MWYSSLVRTPDKDLRVSRSCSPTDWAYFAGLLDGEGCIHRKSRGTVGIKISMTDKSVLDWVHHTFAGRLYARRASNERSSPWWSWEIERQVDVRFILQNVLPFLKVKQRQARLVLDYLECAQVERDPLGPARSSAWQAMDGMNTRGAAS